MLRNALSLRSAVRIVLALAASTMAVSPALAAGNAPVPEPNMVSVLALAIAGVLIGRRLASRKPPRD